MFLGDAEHLAGPLDLLPSRRLVGLREIGRVAEHRDREPADLRLPAYLGEVGGIERVEEAGIELDAVEPEIPGDLDPLEDRHPARDDRVEEALGERGKTRHDG